MQKHAVPEAAQTQKRPAAPSRQRTKASRSPQSSQARWAGQPAERTAQVTTAEPCVPVSYPCDILLAIDTTFIEGTAEVVLRGELDFAITPELFEQLAEVLSRRPDTLIFDMQGVAFIDCGATAALARTARLLPDGVKPVIRNPSYAVRRLLRASRLEMFFQRDEPPAATGGSGEHRGQEARR